MLARIPADVSKRLVPLIPALVLVASACGQPPVGEVDFGSGRQFVPEIADSIDNVGIGASVVFDADGVPWVSYLGFPAELAEGEIAVTRPVGAPFVPGVLLASQNEGIWNRGAAAMYQDPPDRVDVPFGPATVESLADATSENTNGSDIAIGADGTMHVVWTGPDGIWEASGTDSFAAEKVVSHLPPLSQAGPLGWPSVAIDEGGTPWIAAAVATVTGQQIIAATPTGDGWDVQTVAELTPCEGCPDPARTGIAVTPDGPVVVYADPQQGVMAARLDGRRWTTETVDAGADGTGISVTSGTDGAVTAAYYASRDSVTVASSDGAAWRTSEAATVGTAGPSGDGETGDRSGGLSTGVAMTDDGGVFLTYRDPGEDAVLLLSSADGGSFEPIETRGTEAGRWPDVAVTPDGASVSLAWYAPEQQDLAYGTYTEVSGIKVAAPSPPFAVGSVSGGSVECSPEFAEVVSDLEVTALAGAVNSGFEETCLVAAAGEELTLTFDNQDPGQSHNAAFYTAPLGDSLFQSGVPVVGPEIQGPEPVDPQEKGTYYFQCDVHTNMNGSFVVVKASKN